MSVDNSNPFLQGIKGQVGDGKHILTLKTVGYKKINYNGEISDNIEYGFYHPHEESWAKALTGISLKPGTKPVNMIVALAGGNIQADILKDRQKVWSFIQNCIGQQYEVDCEIDEKGWSRVLWDGKKRPQIKLVESSVMPQKKPENQGGGWKLDETPTDKEIKPVSLEDDSIPPF